MDDQRVSALIESEKNLEARLTFLDEIALRSTLAVLPGCALIVWYAMAKAGDKAVIIYQLLPFLLAFFSTFILYNRATTFVISGSMARVLKRLARILETAEILEAHDSLRRSYSSSGRGLPGMVFYGSACVMLSAMYLGAVLAAWQLEDLLPLKIALLAVHVAGALLVLFLTFRVMTFWRESLRFVDQVVAT